MAADGLTAIAVPVQFRVMGYLTGRGGMDPRYYPLYRRSSSLMAHGRLDAIALLSQLRLDEVALAGNGVLRGDLYSRFSHEVGLTCHGRLSATTSIVFSPFTEINTPRTDWPVPPGCVGVIITMVGGGGGGGGGRGNENGSGQGGGGGACIYQEYIPHAALGNTYSVQVGQGGPGGSANNSGVNGTNSVFMSGHVYWSANAGLGGYSSGNYDNAGKPDAVTGYVAVTAYAGGRGGDAKVGSGGMGGGGGNTEHGGAGGGGGGCGTTLSQYHGGGGGSSGFAAGGGGGMGQSTGALGGNTTANPPSGGGGAGGGGGFFGIGAAGSGGNGGLYGGGGGGGGGKDVPNGPASGGWGAAGFTMLEWV